MIKHIFSDMDGTILNPDGNITDETVAAVKQSTIPLTLVSARAPLEMAATIDALSLHEPQIAFNGGLIFQPQADGVHYIDENPIATATAAAIIDQVTANLPDVYVSYYNHTDWFAGKLDAGIEFEQKLTGQTATIASREQTFAQPGFKPFKIMFITFDSQLMERLHQLLNALQLKGVAIQQSGAAYLEITSDRAKKSHGINYILQREHLTAAETAGFGDGHNDLPMLNMVGLPVVMDNALPAIKAVAKHVTKSNIENGVAFALQNFSEFNAPNKEVI